MEYSEEHDCSQLNNKTLPYSRFSACIYLLSLLHYCQTNNSTIVQHMSTCIQAFTSFLKCELTCYRSERNLGSGHHCNIELWWCDWWSFGRSCCLAGFSGLSHQGDRCSGVGGLTGTGQMNSTGGHTWKFFICDITQKNT